MPQLDQIIWFSQVFWLIIGFLVFYFLVLKTFSPLFLKINKMRQKKIKYHNLTAVFFDYLNIEVLYVWWFSFRRIF